MSDYTLRLGPLSFRTTADSGPTEALGNAIEVIGAALTAADPAPKAFTLTLPVGWAGRDNDAHAAGLRARRQVRALLNNTQARMQGLYFSWDVDPELNGWLIVGGGDLEPGDPAGITTAEWKLTLRDCYVAGRAHTVREGIQARTADRRLASTPRDQRRLIYSTDFAAQPGAVDVALPVGATDVTTFGTAPALTVRPTRDGDIAIATGLEDGQTLSFERDPGYIGLGGVWIYDRRGAVDPDDWEAVFGPDQPLTAGDVPVLDNGIARARWDSRRLALDAWDGSGWEERGRIPVGELLSTTVVEWTSQRAVISIIATDGAGQRTQTYVTLQAGWLGPMIERYAPDPTVRFVAASAGTATFRQATATLVDYVASGAPLAAATIAAFTGANWAELTTGGFADAVGALVASSGTRRGADSTVYGGARSFVELPGVGYCGMRFALRLAPLDGIYDPFSTDTSSDYSINGSGYSITGGVLAVSTTATKQFVSQLRSGVDRCVALKFTTGASVTTWATAVRARGQAGATQRHIGVRISQTGALELFMVAPPTTVIASTAGSNLAPRTTYWLVLLTSGDQIVGGLWTADPRTGATAARVVSATTSTSFGGYVGFDVTPGGTDWTYDDFFARAGAGPVTDNAAATLMDTRPQPVLVDRA